MLRVNNHALVPSLVSPVPDFLSRELVTLSCFEPKEFTTPYNENMDGYLFSGIMFTVKTLDRPINLKTFELDVRTDVAGQNLGIEVYTLLDGYTAQYNVPSAWTSVANTNAVPVPGGNGVLIPVQDFSTIAMQPNELRSFYITMNGQYIDSTADALVQAGEEHIQNDVLRVDVGNGLSSGKFSAFDNTLYPKFAGIFHYEEAATTCDNGASSLKTAVDYKFMVNASGLDPSVISTITSETEVFFNDQIDAEDGFLREHALKSQLTQTVAPTSSASDRPIEECPKSFVYCSEISVTASFEHSDALEGNHLLYSLYTMADALRGQLKRGLDKSVLYIGKTAQLSTFKLTLDGVPDSQMSDEQLDFFTTFTQDFASRWIAQSIYAVEIQNQEMTSSASFSKSLAVTGEIRGVNEAGNIIAESFAQNIATAILDHSAEYVEGLAYNVVRPTSTLDSTDAAYFRGIIGVVLETDAVFQSLAPTPTPAPVSSDVNNNQQGGNDSTMDDLTNAAGDANTSSLVIVGVIAVICIAMGVIVAMICCRFKRRRDDRANGKKPYNSFDNTSDEGGDYQFPARTKKLSDSENSFMASSASLDLGSVIGDEKPKGRNGLGSSQRELHRAPSSLGRVSPSPGVGLQRAPSVNGLGSKSILPPPLLQRLPSSRVSNDPKAPPLGRSQSGDGLPSMSSVPRPPPPQRAQSSVAAFSLPPSSSKESKRAPPTARSKSGDGMDLFSPQPQRPTVQKVPSPELDTGTPVKNMRSEPRMPPPGRSKSGDGIPMHTSPRKPQRTKSSSDGPGPTTPASRSSTEISPKPQTAGSTSRNMDATPTRGVVQSNSGQGSSKHPAAPQRSCAPPMRAQSMGGPRVTGQNATPSREPSVSKENGPQPARGPPQRVPSAERNAVPSAERNAVPSTERTAGPPPVRAPPQRAPSMPRTGSSGSGSDHRRPKPPASTNAKKDEAPVSPRRTQSMPNKNVPVSSSKGPSSNQNRPTRPSAPQRTTSMPISKASNGHPSPQPNPARPSTQQPRSDSKPRTPLTPIT